MRTGLNLSLPNRAAARRRARRPSAHRPKRQRYGVEPRARNPGRSISARSSAAGVFFRGRAELPGPAYGCLAPGLFVDAAVWLGDSRERQILMFGRVAD